ncbi:MAG: hypothetical protein GY941_16035 [Planctomycetes bacterium]|nr:hypothetical protein [Planctomycetota bacterium]
MAEVPIPQGLEGTTELPQTRRALHNCFNANGRVIQRPGVELIGTNGGVARGSFEWQGNLYAVVSNNLIRIDDFTTGAYTTIGAIAGTADVVTAKGFNDTAIVVKGGNGYTLDTSETLTQITSINYLPSDSVSHINGYFVYIPTDGTPAFYSDVGAAGTIQSDSFFDAEELPDENRVCINFRNALFIGGDDSFQQFRVIADVSAPFRPVTGRVDNGYLGGILEFDNTFLFIGREKGQDVGIYQMGQGRAPKISNEYIDTVLTTYTQTELSNVRSARLKWRGYDIAVFRLERDAFGYYQGSWFRLSTRESGENASWNAAFIKEFNLKYYVFDSNKFGVLSDVNQDFGEPFEKLIDAGFPTDGQFAVQSLTYRISQGFNENLGSVTLQMSDDNVLYGPPFQRNTGVLGDYTNQLVWEYPGGLGMYDRFMGVRIVSAENINFTGMALEIETR